MKYLYLFASPEEESISQLHDVRLVNGGYFLAPVFGRKIKSEFCNALTFLASRNLQAFDDSWKKLSYAVNFSHLEQAHARD